MRRTLLALLLLSAPAPLAAQYPTPRGSYAIAAEDVELRAAPAPGAQRTGELRAGTIARTDARSPDGNWHAVRTHEVQGWAPLARLIPFDPMQPLAAHAELARRWLAREDASFAELAGVVDALGLRLATAIAPGDERTELAFARYQLMQRAVDAFMSLWYGDTLRHEYDAAEPWILLHADELIYGEPQGSWYVRADLLRDLVEDAADPALAEDIAWYTASQVVPGECEGYLPCIFHVAQDTYGFYLSRHAQGAHAEEALATLAQEFTLMLDYADEDFGHVELCDEVVETGRLGELRAVVVAATAGAPRDGALAAMDELAASCR